MIVSPLDELSRSAVRGAGGARRLDVPHSGSRELIELSASLRTMTEKLLAEEEALRNKIDEVERATKSLRETQDHLVRSERLASVGRLAAGLAHEVGNPIAAIVGMQDLLLTGDLDRSEERLCDYRCQPLVDDMSNWVADKPIPPKYLLSISEVRHQQPGDELYSSSPVTYVKLDRTPGPDDSQLVIHALMRGDSFVTSGEVLMPKFSVTGTGARRAIAADLEWTFPLNFVEVITGDGNTSNRQVISTSELTPMGSKHFEIPFDANGKKWVRFAAWDSAGNGVMSQPVKLNPATPSRD